MPESKAPNGQPESSATRAQCPETVGRYEILGELGRGGCGVVYRALDPSIGRMVAIKMIHAEKETTSGLALLERFRREARSAGSLSHPNIVTIHEFSDQSDPMFIAMEFVDGASLADHMAAGPLSLEFVLDVLRRAADALDYAHSRNIVHRDVKPANFLISKNGQLKITDFGIAKALDSPDEGLTHTGMVVGTVQYMSPEQISATPITGRSDQFSLAVIAYEMLTGVKPFQGNSYASVMNKIVMGEPPPVGQYRDNLSPTVNTVLLKALAKAPEARYAKCRDFCNALENEVLFAAVERSPLLSEAVKRPLAPAPPDLGETRALNPADAVAKPVTSGQTPQPAQKASLLKPVAITVVAALALVGAWLGLRPKPAPTKVVVTTQQSGPVSAPSSQTAIQRTPANPVTTTEPAKTPEVTAAPAPAELQTATRESAKENARKTVKPEPTRTVAAPSSTANSPKAPALVLPPLQTASLPAATPPRVAASPPAPLDSQTVKHAQDDEAKRLADELKKRAADEQARHQAEEQAKIAAAEQARIARAAEQAKAARAAELQAVLRALKNFEAAYEHKDPDALQAIWPTLSKQSLGEIRSSFHDASEMSMELHPLGDPEISGNTATVTCSRSVRQVIRKKVLQSSGQVRILLSRAASGWVIQAVEPVSH